MMARKLLFGLVLGSVRVGQVIKTLHGVILIGQL